MGRWRGVQGADMCGDAVGAAKMGVIWALLAQAPADHLLRWQKQGMRWKWGLRDGYRSHRRPRCPGRREFPEGLVDGFRLDLVPR
mgnify:CR=1 FL=1